MREASRALHRVTACGFERPAANFAARIRHQLDARDASSAYAAPRRGGEDGAARGASGRVEEVQNLGKRGHI